MIPCLALAEHMLDHIHDIGLEEIEPKECETNKNDSTHGLDSRGAIVPHLVVIVH